MSRRYHGTTNCAADVAVTIEFSHATGRIARARPGPEPRRRRVNDGVSLCAMSLADEKYLVLTTFKRDGTPVTTPVWVAPIDDGKIGFWTSSGSGKAKRLARTPKVMVQPCDARGKVKAGTSPTEATAELVTGPQLEGIRTKVKAKYGVMVPISRFFAKIGQFIERKKIPYGDRGVVITPNS